ncbi:MAG: hypothetical protein JWO76_666 [Nocardioides sp.]|nr:hypothetical protein [Nocardioides sp.]
MTGRDSRDHVLSAREEPAGSGRRPNPVTSRRSALVVALVLPFLLAGCGGDETPVARDPAPTTQPAATPTWPDCGSHSQSSIDYVAGARGEDSVEKALARYLDEGTHAVHVPPEEHRADRWDIVTDDNTIVREVSVVDGGHGWLVDGVEECSG